MKQNIPNQLPAPALATPSCTSTPSTPSCTSTPSTPSLTATPETSLPFLGQALIDRAALRSNLTQLRARAAGLPAMAIVKADAYGHGKEIIAETAWENGINWFGLAQLAEAQQLRRFFDQRGYGRPVLSGRHQDDSHENSSPRPGPRIFSWLYGPNWDWESVLADDIEISVSYPGALLEIAAAARRSGKVAAVHLKIETGMGRAGATLAEWPKLLAAARQASIDQTIKVVGIWSHLARGDDPTPEGQAAVAAQLQIFRQAVAQAEAAGFTDCYRHLAASSGTIWHPETHFDLVRLGIAMYGLSPNPEWETHRQLGLTPVMTLRAPLVLVKDVPAGQTVSYGGTWQTETATRLGIVPLGYADGMPRQASNKCSVGWENQQYPQVGRICMDQMVVNLGADCTAQIGDWVEIFGNGEGAAPTADDWAAAADTINYTIVTQLGPRVEKIVLN